MRTGNEEYKFNIVIDGLVLFSVCSRLYLCNDYLAVLLCLYLAQLYTKSIWLLHVVQCVWNVLYSKLTVTAYKVLLYCNYEVVFELFEQENCLFVELIIK